ncbi:SGNH/GDSL hydrolase family protein, partial [bacterium]|nr:SGNH/GDSL hydrolase family protein [bacterium]
NQPEPSVFAKLTGKRVYAAPQNSSLASSRLRYAAWYGFMVDKSSLIDGMTDEGMPSEITVPINNNVMVIGDSLTVGMQSLDATKNYLGKALTDKGWLPTINAQGCRGLYQPSGPIAGVPPNCPKETIVDGLSIINDPAKASQLSTTNTFVLALGTNGTEASVEQFNQKATELITKIKQLSPQAKIYWLNVRLATNGTKQNEYNAAIADVAARTGANVMDWDKYVTQVNSDTSATNDVTWPAKDTTHNDTSGYIKKVEYLVGTLGIAPASVTSPVNCNAAIGNQKIVCAAERFQGAKYAYTSVAKINKAYSLGITGMPSAMRGGGDPETWINTRVPGGANDFIECSGFAKTALFAAYSYKTPAGCSAQFTNDSNKDGFADADKNLKIIPLDQIQPGDFLTISTNCQTDTTPGHVAIFVGKTSRGSMKTIESSAGRNLEGKILSGYYERPSGYYLYASRYVGQGSQ